MSRWQKKQISAMLTFAWMPFSICSRKLFSNMSWWKSLHKNKALKRVVINIIVSIFIPGVIWVHVCRCTVTDYWLRYSSDDSDVCERILHHTHHPLHGAPAPVLYNAWFCLGNWVTDLCLLLWKFVKKLIYLVVVICYIPINCGSVVVWLLLNTLF